MTEPKPYDPQAPTSTEYFAQQVRRHRRAREWSQPELARRCQEAGLDWNRSIVANVEAGRREGMTVQELLTLASVFEVRPGSMLFPPGAPNAVEIPADRSVPWPAKSASTDGVRTAAAALAALVRNEIDHAVMTQAEVAELVGITPKHLNQFLRGHNGMSLDLVDAVLANLGRRLVLATVPMGPIEPVPVGPVRRERDGQAGIAGERNLIARDPRLAATQLHAMVDPEGWYFYPDNEEDAAWFAEHEQARPVHPAEARAAGGQHVLCGLDPCEDCSTRGHHGTRSLD